MKADNLEELATKDDIAGFKWCVICALTSVAVGCAAAVVAVVLIALWK